ncbi:MAG: carboxypeptidase regulatory-like domain-containing protein [Bryobacteraceae bacterium]|jgi:inhibitor of cysteine peptidase
MTRFSWLLAVLAALGVLASVGRAQAPLLEVTGLQPPEATCSYFSPSACVTFNDGDYSPFGANVLTFQIGSSGAQLSFTASVQIAFPPGGTWLQVSPTGAQTTPNSVTVTIDASELQSGAYLGYLVLTSAGAGNSPYLVPISLTVFPTANFQVNDQSEVTVALGGISGITTDTSVQATDGTSAVAFAITPSTSDHHNWLTATGSNSSTTPSNLSIKVDPTGLGSGEYLGYVTLAPNDGTGGAYVAVTFSYNPPNDTISGQVTLSGSGLSGVTIMLTGSQSASTTTGSSGNYSFNVPAGGSYTVTPSLTGYSFTPPDQAFSSLSGNQTANFTATPLITNYTISGQVTLSGSGLSGVTMKLGGSQGGSTTTNASGNYSFTVPAGGSYTVTPSLAGYNFVPPGQAFSSLSGNQTANFTATPLITNYTISGEVTLSGGGLSGVTMTLSGSQSGSTSTNASGSYIFTVPAGGNYTVAPSLAGYRFAPPYQTFSNLTGNQAASFSATLGSSLAGSIAEVVYGGGQWTTTFTLLNTGTSSAQATLNFFAADGTALQLPLTFPNNSSLSPVTTSTFTGTIEAGAGWLIETNGLNDPLAVGSAQLVTNGNIGGFAVLTDTFLSTQVQCSPNPVCQTQAVESFQNLAPGAPVVLWFDNTNGYSTGIALANVSTQSANIAVVIRDDNGNQLSTQTIALPASGQTHFSLTSAPWPPGTTFAGTQNIRGTLEFDPPSNVQISVLGLSFNPAYAFTSIPALAADFSATPGLGPAGSIADLVSGGGQWTTTFTLLNTGTSSAPATLNFSASGGTALQLPLTFPNNSSLSPGTASAFTDTIEADAGLLIETNGLNDPLAVGSAQLVTNGNIGGFAVLTDTFLPTQVQCSPNPVCQTQAVEPFQNLAPGAPVVLWFDNTNGFSTGVALANVSTQSANVTVLIRDDNGNELSTQTIALSGLGQTSFNLTDSTTWPQGANFAMTQNIRGTLEFDPPSSGQISVLGLSFNPAYAFTSIPVLVK